MIAGMFLTSFSEGPSYAIGDHLKHSGGRPLGNSAIHSVVSVEIIFQCLPSIKDFQTPMEPTTYLILSERPLYFSAIERSGDEIIF